MKTTRKNIFSATLFNLLFYSQLTVKVWSSDEFEEDLVHSFLLKTDQLKRTDRLEDAETTWIAKTGYKDAVGVTVDNWSNHRLELPEVSLSLGASDRWWQPRDIQRHTRDIALLSYGIRGSGSKGTITFHIENSWPRVYVSLGWYKKPGSSLSVVLSVTDKHRDYEELRQREVNELEMKVGQDLMRFYKGSDHYVAVVTNRREGEGNHLQLAIIPQNMDYWSWEKWYKKGGSPDLYKVTPAKKLEEEVPQSMAAIETLNLARDELESQPGIFERKELLTKGESVLKWLPGNKTEAQLMAGIATSVGCGLRLENWSQYKLKQPTASLDYGKTVDNLELASVAPGAWEVSAFKQSKTASGVSGVLRWHVGDSNKVISLMVSVPYDQHLWSPWVAAGITHMGILPDFNAMYSGTPDSSWFVRTKMGRHLQFADDELILVVDSDGRSSKPVVRLSVVPLNPDMVATSIRARLEGRYVPGVEGEQSALALQSRASSQCYCPCMEGESASHCLARILLALAFILHLHNAHAIYTSAS